MGRKLIPNFGKKGLSTVIVTLLFVLLSIVAIGIVWVFVRGLINEQIQSTETCYKNYDKITITERYTCYDVVEADNYSLRFSISIGDVDVEKVVVYVASAGAIKSYELTNSTQQIVGLTMYSASGTGSSNVALPAKKAGLTYVASDFTNPIDSVQIAPVISGQQCDTSDSVFDLEDCKLVT